MSLLHQLVPKNAAPKKPAPQPKPVSKKLTVNIKANSVSKSANQLTCPACGHEFEKPKTDRKAYMRDLMKRRRAAGTAEK